MGFRVEQEEVAGSAALPRQPRLSGAERQASIVDAATDVFARRGYEGARIEEIAETAGVSKALIYEHFAGKSDLYAHIHRTSTDEHFRRVLSATGGANGSVEQMERGLSAYLEFIGEYPDRWRVIQQEVSDPAIIAQDHSIQKLAEHTIAQMLAADPEIARQELSEDQLELLGVMINGAIARASDWWVDNESAMGREEVVRYLMRFMWLGLERIRRDNFYGVRSQNGAGNSASNGRKT
jgi:AcrR family transcriptional regulator